MAFLEIRVPVAVSLFLIVPGLPASAALMFFGVGTLIHPESRPDIVPSLVLCGTGVFILLMAIAAFRGILRRKRDSQVD